MARCQAKRGFFMVRTCDAFAKINCAECGIAICANHSIQHGEKILCPECAQKLKETEMRNHEEQKSHRKIRSKKDNDIMTDALWFYNLRNLVYMDYEFEAFDDDDYGFFGQDNLLDYSDEDQTGDSSFFDS